MSDLIWTTEKRKVSELKPFDKNPRKLTDKQSQDLKASLEKFNLVEIPAIDTDGRIIAGHQRISILRALDRIDESIDVRIPNRKLTDEEFLEYNLRSNKNTGEWDIDLLSDIDEDMLKNVGFDSKELDRIFQEDANPKDDDVPDVKTTDIKLGDLFALGGHRLLCGDATKREDVEKLMQGEKADMSFTSPPYNVGHNLGYKNKNSKYINSNDNLEDYVDLITKTTELSLEHAKDVFVNIQLLANNKREVLIWLASLSDKFKDIFFWKKLQVQPAMAKNVANSQVEVIVLFGNDNSSRSFGNQEFHGDFSNYIETNSATRENCNSKIHNATFPVDLPSKFIEHAYKRGSIVLDLFAGTGTTAIACEKLNRKCRMMELAPTYVQVIIDRWEKFTGNKAIKL